MVLKFYGGNFIMPNVNSQGHKLGKAFKTMAKKHFPNAPYITIHRDSYLKFAITGNWKRLESAAKKRRIWSLKGIDRVKPFQLQLSKLYKQANNYVAKNLQGWVPLHSRGDWSDVKSKIKNKLPSGISNKDADKLIQKLGKLRKNDLQDDILKPIITKSKTLEQTVSSWQAATISAELAITIANFNELKRPNLESIPQINKWLKNSSRKLQSLEKTVWQSLKKGNVKTIINKSDRLIHWVSGAVMWKATRTAAALSLARQNRANRWLLGHQALITANLIRDLLNAQLIGLRLTWLARLGFGTFDEWKESAMKLKFQSHWQPPSSKNISHLWKNSKQLNGKIVTIEGVVGPVQNIHRNRKVFSSAWIFDEKGMSMRVGIIHIKLDSGGFVEGAYVKVTGKFVANDKEFGTPIIRVLRRSLVNDSKHSWKDWVLRQNQYLFTPIPHALALSFSWERGVNGPGNQLRYGTWLPNQRRI